eukprot:TRINITY_DN6055_c0_g1_i2.p1 TRINITY_DN6055_c0_g1~~TRINITY_DN6055_c0_g1_i2.p1  ORF type:complete len:268 (-),score=64.35 TRINITY_DN6055_c0_g1_i2:33-836(-)
MATTRGLWLSSFARVSYLTRARCFTLSAEHNQHFNRLWTRNLFIQVHNTPNPESLKFIPTGKTLMENGTKDISNYREASVSPLAKALFQIEGVKGVFLAKEYLSIVKSPTEDWLSIKPQVFSAITEFFDSGKPLINNEETPPKDTDILPEDSETVAMIKEIIETRIRPSIQEDGGDIEYKGFTEDGIVLVKLQGSCRTCPSSSATLKGGVERVMHWVPGVNGVLQVTDDELESLNLEEYKKVEANTAKAATGSDSSASPSPPPTASS